MTSRAAINTIQSSSIMYGNFYGALNESLDETLIKYNEASKLQNVDVFNGTLKRSKGASLFTNAKLTTKIDSLMPFYQNNSSCLIVASNGKLYKLNNDVFNEILSNTSSGLFDYLNFMVGLDNVLIISNGVDNMQVYDGSTFRKVLNRRKEYNTDGTLKDYIDDNGVVHATESDITTYAPKCKFIELHYDRIWAAGDVNNPDRVYFSTSDVEGIDIDDWTMPIDEVEANQHGGFIDIPTFDGSHIIGLRTIFNDVVIFKNYSIFKIFGSSPSNYTKVQIFNSNGAIADKSIVNGGGKAYFANVDGIYEYDGTNVKLVSAKIKDTFNNLNKDYIKYSVGAFYDNKYVLAVPEGTSTVNNLIIVLDVLKGTYTLFRGINVNSIAKYNNDLLAVDSNGYILKLFDGDKFITDNITSFYETFNTDCKTKNANKNTEYLYFIASGNGDIKITLTTNRNISNPKVKTVTLTSDEKLYRLKLHGKGRTIKLRFENVNGSNFEIKSAQLTFEIDYD